MLEILGHFNRIALLLTVCLYILLIYKSNIHVTRLSFLYNINTYNTCMLFQFKAAYSVTMNIFRKKIFSF